MKNTKQNIIDTSKNLFNKNGYSKVTIRMIATQLNMSSGNLNYHFKKKEDILEALYFQMVEPFDERTRKASKQSFSIKMMQEDIISSMKRMNGYSFFWNDLFFILKSNTKINQHFSTTKTARIAGYHYLFSFFIKEDIMKEADFEQEYNLLTERLIDYSNTWLYASCLYDKQQSNEESINKAAFQMLLMLSPYLTQKGKAALQALYPKQLKRV